ncbi:MAG: hypothetical protein AVDCRST_MAG18-3432, partial [uncultured Thermomicrobiales bacterium]
DRTAYSHPSPIHPRCRAAGGRGGRVGGAGPA